MHCLGQNWLFDLAQCLQIVRLGASSSQTGNQAYFPVAMHQTRFSSVRRVGLQRLKTD
jgi:hypothetical protein